MLSVSPTWGFMSSIGMPRTSAMCWETAALLPPMSGEPSVRLTEPSELTTARALAGPVLLPQKPLATPRPRLMWPFSPSVLLSMRGVVVRVVLQAACSVSM